MSSYTKGNRNVSGMGVMYVTENGKNRCLASVYRAEQYEYQGHTLGSYTEEGLSNARLIVSAPKMYELLKEWYTDELEYGIPDEWRHEEMKRLFKYVGDHL